MPTSFPMSIPHAPTGFVNQAALDTAFSIPINDLAAKTPPVPFIGDTGLVGTASAALVTAGTAIASPATFTFTLAVQTRVRIEVFSQFQMAGGTNGRYYARPGYNSGSSAVIGSATGIGFFGIAFITLAGANGMDDAYGAGNDLLAAGTWTAYGILARASGGSATDFSQSSQVIVTAVGNV